MRLVSAVLILMLSVVALATGIALRTVLAGPDTITREVTIEHTAPALLIDGSVLQAYPGRQLVTVYSDESMEDQTITLVYGRTADVVAWLKPARFTQVTFDSVTGQLSGVPRLGSQSTVPNPLGSDLWFEQYQDEEAVRVSLTAGADISVAVFSEGSTRAPGAIELTWPVDNVSPYSTVLIVLGGLLLVGGGVLLVSALTGIRRRRGPKRMKAPRPPKRRPQSARKAAKPRPSSVKPRGRRAATRAAVILIPVIGLQALGACASEVDGPADVPEVETQQTSAPPVPSPAVTEAQFSRIMARIARQVQAADEALDPALLSPRVGEPLLTMRQAAYRLRNADAELGTIVPVPEGPVRLLVPQQSTEWPRVVFAVIQDQSTSDAVSLGVVLRQESPRDNYLLHYAFSLAPETVLPSFPAAAVGSARLARDSKLLLQSPNDTVIGYAEILEQGSDASAWSRFDVLTDILFTVVGPEGQSLREESFGSELSLDLVIEQPEYLSVALATADNGGIVTGVLTEVETVRPVQDGATVNATSAARVFSGVPESTLGFEARYEMHLLWYVPSIGSDERTRILGYTYQLVDANEAPPREE